MRRSAFALLLLLPLPAMASAQSDSTAAPLATTPTSLGGAPTFRPRQWAAQFGIGGGFYGIGALRFSTPTAAWAVGGNVTATRMAQDPGDYTSKYFAAGISLGRRWFRPGAGRVRPFSELGVSGSYGWGKGSSGTYGSNQRSYGGGVYGKLGAMIFFAPELSLGAAWAADASISHDRWEYTNPGGPYSNDRTWWSLNAGRIELTGAFFF